MLLVYFSFLLVYKLTYLQHKHELLVVQGVELDANYIMFQFFQGVVAMSSSQRVNRGRACIVANRDYSEYYMCVHVVCQVTFLCSFQGIINN